MLLVATVAQNYICTAPERALKTAVEVATQQSGPTTIEVENGAALEMPSSNPQVRIFLIASLPALAKTGQ